MSLFFLILLLLGLYSTAQLVRQVSVLLPSIEGSHGEFLTTLYPCRIEVTLHRFTDVKSMQTVAVPSSGRYIEFILYCGPSDSVFIQLPSKRRAVVILTLTLSLPTALKEKRNKKNLSRISGTTSILDGGAKPVSSCSNGEPP